MAARAKRSKKPSAASSGSKPPETLVFFIDRSLGRKVIAQALRELGETVEVHDDHFATDAKDEDWLAAVGKRGWVVLTKDDRIRYRVTERTALATAKVKAFVLTSSQLQGAEMAAAFVMALPRIKRLVAIEHRHLSPELQGMDKFRSCELTPVFYASEGETLEIVHRRNQK